MRIAVFSESFRPVVNGVSVSIATLGDELERLGHEVCTYAPRYPGYEDERPNVFRFPSIRPRSMPDYPVAYRPGPGHLRAFREKDFDLVHTHTPFVMGLTGLRWAGKLGIPVVSTNHTLYTEYVHYVRWAPEALGRMAVLRWMRYYYNRCAAVIVPSAATGQRLAGYGVRKPWTAIPTGIRRFGSETGGLIVRERFGIPPDGRLLVFVGRIAREKNLEMLLSAYRRVREAEGRARLLIVGGGPHLERIKSESDRLGLSRATIFTGALTHGEIADVLREADLFVFASVTETQGLSIGEAASMGVPAIAVRAGGVPEFVIDGETGYLVRDDPAEFAGRVIELLRDEDRRGRFSDAARAFAGTMTVESMARRVLDVYDAAVKAGK